MKKINYFINYSWLLAVLIIFSACDEDDGIGPDTIEPLPELTSGSADFSTYVALGNSLTAGFTDGALFVAGQQNSLPNILAGQFALTGGGNFTQPLTNDNIGGLLFGGQENPDFGPRFFFDGVGPVRLSSSPTTETFNVLSGPFNNLGVPGAKSFHLLFDGYGNPQNLALGLANPYYVRFASAPNATVVGDALSQSPTFFSLWIGNNDVLGYALSGGESDTTSEDFDGITDEATFNFAYSTIVGALTGSGAGGVVANIPDVTSIPHFTTVPFNPLNAADPAFGPQIPLLNTIYGAINNVYDFLETIDDDDIEDIDLEGRDIIFSSSGESAVVIRDENLRDLSAEIAQILGASPTFPAFVQSFGLPAEAAPLVAGLLGQFYGQARQATADDLFVLPVSSVIGTVNADTFAFLQGQGLSPALAGQFAVEGISLPLADKWVLIPSEQAEIKSATDNFNNIISSTASQAGLAFVDANDLLIKIQTGDLESDDFSLTSQLVLGGAFSLDGVHPTARGYALIANQFLKAIDTTYGSNFEESGNLVDIGEYPTNYSPMLQ